jgi:predicted membrane protein
MKMKKTAEQEKRGRLITGLFLMGFGLMLFGKKMGISFPWWLFSWQMFLIALGVYLGFKHSFRNPSTYILIAIGSIFLWDEMTVGTNLKPFVWPIAFIGAGLFIIFKPKAIKNKYLDIDFDGDSHTNPTYSIDNSIESINIFSGGKKNVISKQFRGGEIVNIMGGTEVNLMQADFHKSASIESVNIFGSTKLIIPSNWALHSEVVSVFGGVEDKRNNIADAESAEKIIVLQGVNVFGGIEIKSY